MLPNVPYFPMAYFGILKAGAMVVPMNVLLKAPEIAFYLRDSEAKILITWGGFADEAMKGAAEAGVKDVYVAAAPGADGALPDGARPFAELLSGSPDFDMEATDADDTAVLLYTSGTTGKPKGAELTHFNLYMNCDVLGRLCGAGGASMPGEVLTTFEKRFGVTILEGYGLSETSPTASFNRSQQDRKFLSIGKPIWGVEMKVFDENDQPLGAGKDHVGEIV